MQPEQSPRPLRNNGIAYQGINGVMVWSASVAKGFARPPLSLTFHWARELGGHVKKGETAELVGYADHITRAETNERGADVTQEIPS